MVRLSRRVIALVMLRVLSLFFQFGKFAADGLAAKSSSIIISRRTGDGFARFNGFAYATLRIDPGAITNLYMANDTCLSTDHYTVTNFGAATDS